MDKTADAVDAVLALLLLQQGVAEPDKLVATVVNHLNGGEAINPVIAAELATLLAPEPGSTAAFRYKVRDQRLIRNAVRRFEEMKLAAWVLDAPAGEQTSRLWEAKTQLGISERMMEEKLRQFREGPFVEVTQLLDRKGNNVGNILFPNSSDPT